MRDHDIRPRRKSRKMILLPRVIERHITELRLPRARRDHEPPPIVKRVFVVPLIQVLDAFVFIALEEGKDLVGVLLVKPREFGAVKIGVELVVVVACYDEAEGGGDAGELVEEVFVLVVVARHGYVAGVDDYVDGWEGRRVVLEEGEVGDVAVVGVGEEEAGEGFSGFGYGGGWV